MKVAVIGNELQSYVTAALLASVGNQVVFFNDAGEDQSVLREPGLESLYHHQLETIRLCYFSTEQHQAERFDFVFLADISPQNVLEKYQDSLLVTIKQGACFIILTPSEIGEAQKFSKILNNIGEQVSVCCVPMLHREGRAIEDFSRPEKLIIGCDDELHLENIKNLFYPFNRVKNTIKCVSTKEAEFSSFAGNAMLATRLGFMNEMANLAESSNVDIDVVRECIGSDPRIGQDYLYPGCGYGGKVLAENVAKIARKLHSFSDNLGLLDTVEKINQRQKDLLFRKIWRFFETELKEKTIAIWGASFKPRSSSIEGAPSIHLINSLLSQSANVIVYDPMAQNSLEKHYLGIEGIKFATSAYSAIEDADVLAICTEWKEFWNPDLEKLKVLLKAKAVFDGRNILEPRKMKTSGLQYFGIGRGEKI